ncbi:MAG: hypothetical protein K9M57_06575 [Phycisphaerae bacterium]|nr:hypothetical protein [Phycisphaerae bacterium]
MTDLAKNEILLGVTGGIAAYKSAMLCSELVKLQASVTVIMTQNAQHFIAPLTFSTLTSKKVYTDMWASQDIHNARHISLTDRADLTIIAPATANIIGKMANGICDDLLSTTLCSLKNNILVAPAMNQRMWANAAVQRNIQYLLEMGCHIIGPETGRLACGDQGPGRMAEPQDILNRVLEILQNKTR